MRKYIALLAALFLSLMEVWCLAEYVISFFADISPYHRATPIEAATQMFAVALLWTWYKYESKNLIKP